MMRIDVPYLTAGGCWGTILPAWFLGEYSIRRGRGAMKRALTIALGVLVCGSFVVAAKEGHTAPLFTHSTSPSISAAVNLPPFGILRAPVWRTA